MKKFTDTNSLFSLYEKVYKDDFAIKFNKYPNFSKSLIDYESINIFMLNYNYDVSDELRFIDFISNKYNSGYQITIDDCNYFDGLNVHLFTTSKPDIECYYFRINPSQIENFSFSDLIKNHILLK